MRNHFVMEKAIVKSGFQVWQTGSGDKAKGNLDGVYGFSVFPMGFHQRTVVAVFLAEVIWDCMNEYSPASFLTYVISECKQ